VLFHSSSAVSIGILVLHLLGLSSEGSSINFIETVMLTRADVFVVICIVVIALVLTSILLILSLPVLAVGITMLLLDREFNSSILSYMSGGDPIIFQHMFWYFGHPEVYIVVLPAFGVLSYIIIDCSYVVLFGSCGMILALTAIGVIGFCV